MSIVVVAEYVLVCAGVVILASGIGFAWKYGNLRAIQHFADKFKNKEKNKR